MLWYVSGTLALVWLATLVIAGSLGGFVHILLVLALAVLLIQLTMGHRAV